MNSIKNKVNRLNINELNLFLLISSMLGICFLIARVVYSGELTYIFLTWNLFLAWIPYLLSHRLCKRYYPGQNRFILLLWICVWLLFYPNASYIVTDLFHLSEHNTAPKWFDLILIMLFAWNGLVLGILSLYDMQNVVKKYKGNTIGNVFMYLVLLLTGFGVYLGRYERWNSWDIIVQSEELIVNILYIVAHPLENTRAYGFTLIFSMFLGILYFMFLNMVKNLGRKGIL